jgi:hypothetical protein
MVKPVDHAALAKLLAQRFTDDRRLGVLGKSGLPEPTLPGSSLAPTTAIARAWKSLCKFSISTGNAWTAIAHRVLAESHSIVEVTR